MNFKQEALNDLSVGFKDWRVWTRLGWRDIKMRYHRSLIGPFWLAITTAIWAVGLGLVWATLFNIKLEGFMPYLTAGIVVWTFVTQVIIDASGLFVDNKQIINSINLPISIHIYRFIYSHVIVFFHNLPVFFVIAYIFDINMGWHFVMFFPGLFLIVVNCLWISLLFGLLGARFRDLKQIVTNILQVLFFITPIFWERSFLRHRTYIADLNPLYHFLEVVRGPLLGKSVSMLSYGVTAGLAVFGWTIAILFFRRFRMRIHYWI